MAKPKIWLSSPHIGGSELTFIADAFSTNWIAPLGPNVDGFEKDLEQYTGARHVAALSSGTAAIHLALIILGVERGDEVICQSFTFSASANPIVYQGAVPVFVDSEIETWNMDPYLLEETIKDRLSKGKKPKAIIVVYLYGMPAKIEEIKKIATTYKIPLIEDAAEALGSKYKGLHVGSFCEMGILSFNGNKIVTTSGGGALISNKKEYIEQARFLATQARDDAPHYQHSVIGYNYRMSNVLAGIGRGQMKVIDDHIERRRAVNLYYRRNLFNLPGISFLQENSDVYFSNHWLTCIIVDPPKSGGIMCENIRLALMDENIEARPLWKPMHLQPIFKNAPRYENGTSESLFKNGLCLPSGSNLTEIDLQRVVKVIRNCFSF